MAINDGNQYNTDATADLFNCNLDPSGQYTFIFSDDVDRDNHFSSTPSGSNIVVSRLNIGNNYTYIRKDGILKVPYNADYLDSLGINYCRYKNSQSTFPPNSTLTRFIYAFVDSIEYVAPEVSALHIRTDSFITYQSNIVSNQQYILRKTVNSAEDTLTGANDGNNNLFLSEPINGETYRLAEETSWKINASGTSFFNNFKIGVLAKPFDRSYNGSWLSETLDPNKDLKVELNDWCGHQLSGFPSGANVFVCDIGGLVTLATVLNMLGSEVIATFWLHKDCSLKDAITRTVYYQSVTAKESITFSVLTTAGAPAVKDVTPEHTYQAPFFDGGYIPINNKCYNYPYNYIVASDNKGSLVEYRFEDFPNRTPSFNIKFTSNTENALVLIPNNYMGTNTSLDYSMIVEGFPQIPYMSSDYAYYLGTHNANTAIAKYTRYMDYGKSIYDSAKGIIRSYTNSKLPITDKKKIASETAKRGQDLYDSIENAVVSIGKSVDNSISAVAEGVDANSKAVNVMNAGSVSTLTALGFFGVSIYYKYLCTSDIKIIDDYFSRYGYNWCKEENLDLRHCTDYSYIKTAGCNIEGAIPVADKQNLNALFDAGITIWKNKQRYGMFADGEHHNK